MITNKEHGELDDAVGILPDLTPEQQAQAETGATWLPESPRPNTLTRGTLAN